MAASRFIFSASQISHKAELNLHCPGRWSPDLDIHLSDLAPPSVGAFCLVRLAPDLAAPAIGRGERKMRPCRQPTSEAIHLLVCQLDKAGIAGPFLSAI